MSANGRFRLYAVTESDMPLLASKLPFNISRFFENLLAGLLVPRTLLHSGASNTVRVCVAGAWSINYQGCELPLTALCLIFSNWPAFVFTFSPSTLLPDLEIFLRLAVGHDFSDISRRHLLFSFRLFRPPDLHHIH